MADPASPGPKGGDPALAETGAVDAALAQTAAGDAALAQTAAAALADTGAAPPPEVTPRRPVEVARDAARRALLSALESWDRYRVVRPLGRGGMGDVLLAVDDKLGRQVALKFLHEGDPELERRLAEEARAQARVEHPHVCKVYEVGEVAGLRYIAMQYIDGPTLAVAQREMTLEQRVLALVDIAEALHAAHRVGLIHRDVKPANILVERGEGGRFHPYVTDFGLARQAESPDETSTGTAGTPYYMAPEQIRGEVQLLDRRTDVYALGATLYELAVGHPPFRGSLGQVISQVLGTDAPRPRAEAAAISLDLEAIILKCLEKSQRDRYDSARALADDLRRFLDGEPVAARRAGIIYRIRKRAAKHKALVTVGALAAATAATLGWTAVRARRAAAETARLAQELGAEVGAVDAIVRYGALLPLHDVTPERALVRARMKRIEERSRPLGALGVGPREAALGRAALALDEPAEARGHLEAAWAAGDHRPEVAAALGQALGALYKAARDRVHALPTEEQRQAREAELARTLRDPALRALREGAAAQLSAPGYGEALIAFYEGRSDEALARARQAAREVPWLFEAARLEGQIHLAAAQEKVGHGDPGGAAEAVKDATAALDRAATLARSDARTQQERCRAGVLTITIKESGGHSSKATVDEALAACTLASRIAPDDPTPHWLAAEVLWRWGDGEDQQGRSPWAAYARAQGEAGEAVRLAPQDVDALRTLAMSFEAEGEQRSRKENGDPREPLGRARRVLDRALALDARSPSLESVYALTCLVEAEWEADNGVDAERALACVREHADRAIALDPRFGFPYDYRAKAWLTRGELEQELDRDPRAFFDKAIADYEAADRVARDNARVLQSLAAALSQRIGFDDEAGRDAGALAAKWRQVVERALAANPEVAQSWTQRAAVGIRDARLARARGDARQAITLLVGAREDALHALEIDPQYGEGRLTIADAEIALAALGHHPDENLAAAEARLREIASDDDTPTFEKLAEVELSRARLLATRGAPPEPAVARGLGWMTRALANDPRSIDGLQLRAELLLERARALPVGRRAAAARAAVDAFAALAAVAPVSARRVEAKADEARRLAGR